MLMTIHQGLDDGASKAQRVRQIDATLGLHFPFGAATMIRNQLVAYSSIE
jgi:hypothetical protein